MTDRKPKVLDVGQCDPDHRAIRHLLEEQFAANVARAENMKEALAAVRSDSFDLVLVNRLLDLGGEGMQVIEAIKGDEGIAATPVMLVSNYDDAQDAAVAAGTVRGFGKDALGDPRTVELLAAHLHKHD